VIAEASTSYLFSKTAVPGILAYAPDARFMVMIRSPLEMAHALHDEQLYQGDEDIADFTKAWSLQGERAAGHSIPASCRDAQLLQYGPFCRLGEQLDRLYGLVPRTRVHVAVLDDVKVDAGAEYSRVLEFLGLCDDARRIFPIHNASKRRRSGVLARAIRKVGAARRALGPTYRGLGLLNRVSSWNRVARQRPRLSPDTERELSHYFRDDLALLSDLMNRDLTDWLRA
jgi:hypothetical protein